MTVRSSARTRTWLQRGFALTAATATAVALGSFSDTADAASGWDRLAECESGQRWDIDTGNGYYGGLQFSKGSWDAAGGERYAGYPHQASRSEQIAVAEQLLDLQGVDAAWPACSDALGLTDADLQSGGGDGGGDTSSDESSSEESSSDESSSEQSSTGTYEVQSGDTLARIAARLDVDGGWKALYGANEDAISDPGVIYVGQELDVPGVADPAPADRGSSGSYRVQAGDTLVGIADAEAVTGGWKALYRANDAEISDPNVIRVGQVLELP